MIDSKHTILLKNLGLKITDLRKAQKLSKVQLAFEIGTSEGYIRRIEKGSVNVGAVTLFRIAETLNVPVQSLFDF